MDIDTVHQHHVLNIGRLDMMTPKGRRDIEEELAELEEGAELISRSRELLFEHDYSEELWFVDEITPEQALDYGPVAALVSIAEHLDLE